MSVPVRNNNSPNINLFVFLYQNILTFLTNNINQVPTASMYELAKYLMSEWRSQKGVCVGHASLINVQKHHALIWVQLDHIF